MFQAALYQHPLRVAGQAVLILLGLGLAMNSVLAADQARVVDVAEVAPRATEPEYWRANFQSTYVWQKHPGFSAAYDGPNSLVRTPESGYTLTATLYVGLHPWRGTEIFANPEIIQSEELSELRGLGGFSNSENQKNGGPKPTLYSARLFVRQTIDLGGDRSEMAAGQNQFASRVSRRRLVITVGQVSLIDIFDPNAYAHDGRTQFMNWMFMTHSASDYAADSRGYTWGMAVELYLDNWAFRLGRFAQPKQSNGLAMDFNLWEHYGDTLEIEHSHTLLGRPGKVRIMGVHNRARMGGFDDATNYAHENGGTPDLGNVRRDRSKFAVGLALEQSLATDLGFFGRLNWNDGRTEAYAFTEVDRAFAAGAVMRGSAWRRPSDTLGVGLALEGISDAHRAYLASGGLGQFIGDGKLPNYASERILEIYYACAPTRGFWASAGYQWIGNPAYNADRGPVSIFSARFHAEY